MFLDKYIMWLEDLLFPPHCPICDEILGASIDAGRRTSATTGGRTSVNMHNYICEACSKKVVRIKAPYCAKCGKPLTQEKEYCKDCLGRRHFYIQGMSVFDYGSVSDSLYRFKNKGRQEYARFYAVEILKARGKWLKSINPDALIPVPIHKSKIQSRGYNQAELISKEISKITQIPTITNLVVRTKKTSPLKALSLTERQNNIKNAFNVSQNAVKLKTIVIIDDIYTTGTTIDEISRVIKSKYDCNIYFLTLAIGRG